MTEKPPYFKTPKVEAQAAKLYADGFNIYMFTSRMKKDLGRKQPFPDDIILDFCRVYWSRKNITKNTYPYFKKTFVMVSANWHSNRNAAEGEALKKATVPKEIMDLMKGIFNE